MLARKEGNVWVAWRGRNTTFTNAVEKIDVKLTADIVEQLFSDDELDAYGIKRVADPPEGMSRMWDTQRIEVNPDGSLLQVFDYRPAPIPETTTTEEVIIRAFGRPLDEAKEPLGIKALEEKTRG
jgi:hypothetical protein